MRKFNKFMLLSLLSINIIFLTACGAQSNNKSDIKQESNMNSNQNSLKDNGLKDDDEESKNTSDDAESRQSTKGARVLVNESALAEKDDREKFIFTINGVEIKPGVEAEPIISALGDANSIYEAPSCVFEGMDKVYAYDGFEINTAPYNGIEVVVGLFFTDDDIETAKGISIGSKLDDALTAYGEPDEQEDVEYTWRNDEVEFTIVAIEDEITSITYIGRFEGYN